MVLELSAALTDAFVWAEVCALLRALSTAPHTPDLTNNPKICHFTLVAT